MAKQDYYDLLGIAKNASKDDIKKAYRIMAMKYHPDRNAGNEKAEQKFKEINEAYEVLNDDNKRTSYDRFGHAAFDDLRRSQSHSTNGFDFSFRSGGFSTIFEEMFDEVMGSSRTHQAAAQGADLRYNLEITLEEAFTGIKKSIQIQALVVCDTCHGKGTSSGTQPQSCNACGGGGQIRSKQGFFTVERSCPACRGTGYIIKNPCSSCKGAGRSRQSKTLEVSIPAGVEEGNRIRLAGEGEAGRRGSSSGDLYIFLVIAQHPFFKRDKADLYCNVTIPMTIALLGGSVEVPSIDGKMASLQVPAGIQNGGQVLLRKQGMSMVRRTDRGNAIFIVEIETPIRLNSAQQQLIREFLKKGNLVENNPRSERFTNKVKAYLKEAHK